jgi:hypothetical protein
MRQIAWTFQFRKKWKEIVGLQQIPENSEQPKHASETKLMPPSILLT